ncbi:hypothetical protein I551_3008 [Mycobacterium ulcerans str. Harvey]|uniref:Uncharacterized protein n=1 Tax=Mycobacterium ulcerans str. Harvey TaxID=1299332 RepID=A0ABP3AHT6_MYCUL|nr:hypothetical protein I551_3008 [Mycobacterium ulcerans str. Harvey]
MVGAGNLDEGAVAVPAAVWRAIALPTMRSYSPPNTRTGPVTAG